MGNTKLNHFINRAIPTNIREDYPQFALFVEKYFEYISRDLGEYDISVNLLNYIDIDETVADFYEDFKSEYIPLLPEKYKANLATIVKNASNFYQTKGTEDSFKTFFRMIFDTTVDLYYPKVDMLRASDGKWTEPYYLTPLGETIEDLEYYFDKSITGSVSGATAYVESILQITDPDDINAKIFVVSLVDRVGVFDLTDTITVEGEVTPSFVLNTAGTKGIITGQGYWKDTDGFLSWDKYIQDSDYYQDYSYVLESPISVELYEKPIRDNLHPAGLKFFSRVATGITVIDIGGALLDYIDDIIQWVSLELVEQSINTIKQVLDNDAIAPLNAGGNDFDWKYYELNRENTAFRQMYNIEALGSLPISHVSDNYPDNFADLTIDGVPSVAFSILNDKLTLNSALGSDAVLIVNNLDPSMPEPKTSYTYAGKTGEIEFTLPVKINRMNIGVVVSGDPDAAATKIIYIMNLSTTSIEPLVGRTEIFDRNSEGLVRDYQNVLRKALPDELRYEGFNRVENLIYFSEDFNDPSWNKDGTGDGIVPIVTSNYAAAPFSGSLADRIQFDSGVAGNSQLSTFNKTPNGSVGVFSVYLKSLTVDTIVTIYFGGAIKNITVTTSWKRFYFSTTSLITDLRLAKRDAWSSSGTADLLVFGAQVQEKTGSNDPTIPDDYVSTGVGITKIYEDNFVNNIDEVTLGGSGAPTKTQVNDTVVITSTVADYGQGNVTIPVIVGKTYKLKFSGELLSGGIGWIIVGDTSLVNRYITQGLTGTYDNYEILVTAVDDNIKFTTQTHNVTIGDSVSMGDLFIHICDHGANVDGVKVFDTENSNTINENMVKYSQDFTNPIWAKYFNSSVDGVKTIAPDGTLTADHVIFDGTPNCQIVQSVDGFTIGIEYVLSIYVKADDNVQVEQKLFTPVGLVNFTPTEEWTQIHLVFTPTATTHGVILLGTSSIKSSYYVWGAQVNEGRTPNEYVKTLGNQLNNVIIKGPDIPLDFTRDATNSCLWNRDFGNAVWGKVGSLEVTQDQVGIEGRPNTAWTISDTSTGDYGYIQQLFTIPSDGNTITHHTYIKKDTDITRFVEFQTIFVGGTSAVFYVDFNTSTGEIYERNNSGSGVSNAELVYKGGNYWWKVTISLTNNNSGNISYQYKIFPAVSSVWGNVNVVATGSIVVDAPQIELNQSTTEGVIFTEDKAVSRRATIGKVSEPQRTNKCTNYNANPDSGAVAMGTLAAFGAAGVTNVVAVNGDVNTLYGVVDDSIELAAAGLDAICTDGLVLKIDNSSGAARASFIARGVTNTNAHTLSIQARGDGSIHLSGRYATSKQLFSSTDYAKVEHTDISTGTEIAISVEAGDVGYFILNQLEEGVSSTSPIIVEGSSTIRETDIRSISSAKIPSNDFVIKCKINPFTLNQNDYARILDTSASVDGFHFYIHGTSFYLVKVISGSSDVLPLALSPVVDFMDITIVFNSTDGFAYSIDGTDSSYSTNANNMIHTTDLFTGSSNGAGNFFNGSITDLVLYKGKFTLAEAKNLP